MAKGQLNNDSNQQNSSTSATTSAYPSMPSPSPIPTTYARIDPLPTSVPLQDSELSIFKLAKEVLSSVKPGADVTNINLPANILDPVSTLEKAKKSMQRGELLQDLCNPAQDAQSRFLNVLRFNFSGLARERFGKKPYNPIIGEVFRCCFVHRNTGGESVLLVEQVSHHPPVTALHLRNETLGFVMNSHTAPEPSFWGNSLEVKLSGEIRIVLEKFDNEEYVITRPYIYMTGFLAGRQRLEFNGLSTFECRKTDLGAEVEYKAKGSLAIRADMNGITGRIFQLSTGKTLYTLDGNWDKIVTLTNAATQEQSVLFDYETVASEKSMFPILPPEKEEEASFSTRVWSECSKAIINGQSKAANDAKRKVEDHQRHLRKERTETNTPWQHHYFIKRTDIADGYDLRSEFKGLKLIKLSVTPEELASLKSGELVEAMLAGSDSDNANGETARKGIFKRKLTLLKSRKKE